MNQKYIELFTNALELLKSEFKNQSITLTDQVEKDKNFKNNPSATINNIDPKDIYNLFEKKMQLVKGNNTYVLDVKDLGRLVVVIYGQNQDGSETNEKTLEINGEDYIAKYLLPLHKDTLNLGFDQKSKQYKVIADNRVPGNEILYAYNINPIKGSYVLDIDNEKLEKLSAYNKDSNEYKALKVKILDVDIAGVNVLIDSDKKPKMVVILN